MSDQRTFVINVGVHRGDSKGELFDRRHTQGTTYTFARPRSADQGGATAALEVYVRARGGLRQNGQSAIR